MAKSPKKIEVYSSVTYRKCRLSVEKSIKQSGYRFDIPKSAIISVGRNVILGMDYAGVFRHRVDRDAPLPEGPTVS
jgi:hypothetical protein